METVISCVKTKEWQGKPIYTIGLSDGQGGESFAVQIPIGTPLSDLTIEPSQWGNKIKLKKTASGGGYAAQRQRGGNESFALAYSKDLVVGGKVELKDLLKTADKLYEWLEGKKQPTTTTQAPVPTPGTTVIQKQVHATVPNGAPTDDLPF